MTILRFSYVVLILDVSRHFFPVDSVKRFIDMLALHNMNRFHWHLTDDQGWRIEIKGLPELTEVGSKRTEPLSVITRENMMESLMVVLHTGRSKRNCSLCCRTSYHGYS